nr:DEAD/DEAH box helicase [Saprospiraceae bacterium]
TDVVSRGIDIANINLVINYDVPTNAEDYVHRVGRTARASTTGVALTLINPYDMYRFKQIEELIEMEVMKIPLPPELGDGPTWDPTKKSFRGNGKGHSKSKGGKKHFNRKGGKPRKK